MGGSDSGKDTAMPVEMCLNRGNASPRRMSMNRRFASIAVCLVCTGLFAASCNKSTDQPSGPDANSSPSVAKEAKAAGRFKGGAVLSLTLTNVTVDGKDYEIQTSAPTMASKGKGKRTAAMVGGGAGGGALIGGLAGGGKGAVI